MRRYVVALGTGLASLLLLVACGSGQDTGSTTPTPDDSSSITPGAIVTMTPTIPPTLSTYPKFGHAPDYSWIAGQVAFTRIQGSCTYINTAPPEATPQESVPGPGTPVVSTPVKADTSPPLRDITPVPPDTQTAQPVTSMFIPGGTGWDPSQFKNGDYVVAFGHIAGPGEPREMCPGGTSYVIDRVLLNP
jgi:hypothetical protein